MTARRTTALLLATLILTGCSTGKVEMFGSSTGEPEVPEVTTAAKPTMTPWGTAATGQGEQGKPLEVTPLGVYYHPGDAKMGASENGMFVAVSVKVAASEAPDHVPPPMTGQGFYWKGGGESISPAEGGQPPWIGRVNTPISTQEIQAGEYAAYVITFDVPERGGTLAYISPDKTELRWAIPKKSGGPGLRRVLTALDAVGVKR
ncbi:hypothetical protein [Streptosporangium roseum]|uniref:hypothetical protein n=1 Tax=Streptosporangium roseum TaxID=2001 RepID=UPI003321D0CF